MASMRTFTKTCTRTSLFTKALLSGTGTSKHPPRYDVYPEEWDLAHLAHLAGDLRDLAPRLATGLQSCISRSICRQCIGSFVRNSYVSTLCPVVICPYLCTSEAWTPRAAASRSWRSPSSPRCCGGGLVTLR